MDSVTFRLNDRYDLFVYSLPAYQLHYICATGILIYVGHSLDRLCGPIGQHRALSPGTICRLRDPQIDHDEYIRPPLDRP